MKRKWNKFLNCFYYFKLWTSFYRLQQAFFLHTILFSYAGYIKTMYLLHPSFPMEFNVFLISNFPSKRKHLLIPLPSPPPQKMISAKMSLQKSNLQNALKIPFLQNTSVRLLLHNRTVMNRKNFFFWVHISAFKLSNQYFNPKNYLSWEFLAVSSLHRWHINILCWVVTQMIMN